MSTPEGDHESQSLSDTIKGLLDTTNTIKTLSTEMKGFRQKRKLEEEYVKGAMSEQGLRVVRVLKHKCGPHDFVLGQRTKKRAVTTKQIKTALATLEGERIDSSTFDSLLDRIKRESVEEEPITFLRINKCKTEETGRTAEVQ